MTKATYRRKHLIWSSSLQRVRIYDRHGGKRDGRQAGVVIEQNPRAHILSSSKKQGKITRNGMGF